MSKLIVANGRGNYSTLDGHLYVCAKSKAHAVRLLVQAGHINMTIREFNEYWNKDAWGVVMNEVTPEVGVWFVPENEQFSKSCRPRRLL